MNLFFCGLRRGRRTVLATVLLLVVASVSSGSERAGGDFMVERDCPAYQSFRKASNPGSRTVRAGESYPIVEVNDARAIAWVRLRLDGGEPRWVAVDCGTVGTLRLGAAPPPVAAGNCSTAEEYDSFVLALTWQPGFCEHSPYRTPKPECQAMASGKLTITHLTLHGLWPNKGSCGKDYGHCPGGALDLSEETLAYIRPWMPNAYFGTAFAGYQWQKHGVCQRQLDDDGYFRRAVEYVKLVNESPLGAYIAANVGGTIDRERFFRLVAETWGEAARHRVQLICTGTYLQEIRIRLPRQLKPVATLADLFAADPMPALPADGAECRGGRIAVEKSGP